MRVIFTDKNPIEAAGFFFVTLWIAAMFTLQADAPAVIQHARAGPTYANASKASRV